MTEALNNLKTDADDTVTEEGLIVGQAEVTNKAGNNRFRDLPAGENTDMPPIVNFEDENVDDVDANAMMNACRQLEKLTWAKDDLQFVFASFELRAAACGVKKNYTKFQVLSSILPPDVQQEVKHLLIMQATEFPNGDAYKQLKKEILRIFGPKKCSGVNRALGRVLTGLPSQLARALVNDICTKKLDCDCCPRVVEALWKRQLSSAVLAGIAHCTFSKDTFTAVTELADEIHSTQPGSAAAVQAMSVAAVRSDTSQSADDTLPAMPYPVPEVAAASRGGGWRGGRGPRNRGGRGGNNRGGGRGGGGGSQPKHSGTKHPDLPSGEWKGCSMHFKWGRSAHFCSEPGTCPWKDVFTAKPARR